MSHGAGTRAAVEQVGVGNEFAIHGRRAVGIHFHVELAVLVEVYIKVVVHAGVAVVVVDGGGNLFAGDKVYHLRNEVAHGVVLRLLGECKGLRAVGATRKGDGLELTLLCHGALGHGDVIVLASHLGRAVVLREVGRDAHIALHYRNRAGVVLEGIGGNDNVFILRGVVHQAVAVEVVAHAYYNVRKFEAVGGLHLESEGLAVGDAARFELRAVGIEYLAVGALGVLSARHGHFVSVHIETGVHNHAAVVDEQVAGIAVTASIDAVPVHLVAQAVVAGLQVGRHGEGGWLHAAALVVYALALAVLVLVVGVGHHVAAFGGRAVVVERGVELTVAEAVKVHVTVHPRTGVVRAAHRHGFAGLCAERISQLILIAALVALLVDAEDLAVEENGVGKAVVARQRGVLIEVDGVRAILHAGRGVVVDLNIIYIHEEVLGQGVCGFAVGHDDEAVYVDAASALNGKHGVEPLVLHEGRGAEFIELLYLGRLVVPFLALAQSHEHHAAGVGAVHHDVHILHRGGEFEGLAEVHPHAEHVAGEAGALEAQHVLRHVGFAGQFVYFLEGVCRHGHVALQALLARGVGAEGGVFP